MFWIGGDDRSGRRDGQSGERGVRGNGGRGLAREELIFRRRSALFDASLALGELGIEPTLSIEAGMKELARWVADEGGLDAIVRTERKAPTVAELAAESEAADAVADAAP